MYRQQLFLAKTAIAVILVSQSVFAQTDKASIAQFVVWQQKENQLQNFENGYKQHLEWHKANKDPWSWYGWYFISGPRYGWFMDATFEHAWSDYDHAVKPAEDGRDNRLHVFPFGDVRDIRKASFLESQSIHAANGLKAKYLRMLAMRANDFNRALALFDRLKEFAREIKLYSFLVFKVVDGGYLNEFMVLIGSQTWADFSKVDLLFSEISKIESGQKSKIFESISSETLIYREDMSYFPE